MPKIILILILVLVVLAGIYLMVWKQKPEIPPAGEIFPSPRAGKYSISSGEGLPQFTKELIADPVKPKIGEKQIFSIWAKDQEGIEKVIGKILTDTGEETIKFDLVEGTIQEGRWQGLWITKNISPEKVYGTSFEAADKEGKTAKLFLHWQAE